MLALWWVRSSRNVVAFASLGLATASKLLPIVLLPFFWRSTAFRPLPMLGFVLVLIALYAPFADPGLFSATLVYGSAWSFNGSAFAVLEAPLAVLCRTLEQAGVKFGNLVYYPHNIAKGLLALAAVTILWRGWRMRWSIETITATFLLLFVICTPTLHPWYLAFLVPFVTVWQRAGTAAILAMLSLTATAFLFHSLPASADIGTWQGKWWLRVFEYLPFYVGVALVVRAGRDAAPYR